MDFLRGSLSRLTREETFQRRCWHEQSTPGSDHWAGKMTFARESIG
jgi:hypothetical protein